MIYSGADLIRTSGQQQERMARLKVAHEVKPVEGSAKSKSSLDEETQSALLRFARFVKGDREQKKPSFQNKTSVSKQHPYITAEDRVTAFYELGQNIDIYA